MLVLLLRVARQDGSSKAVCPITPHICGLQDLVLLRCKLGAASVRDYDHCVQHLDNHCFYYYLVDFSDHDILILLRSLFNCLLITGMCFDMMVCASTYAGLYISCMHNNSSKFTNTRVSTFCWMFIRYTYLNVS